MFRRKLIDPILSASIAALFVQSQKYPVSAASFYSFGYNKMSTTFRDSNGVITVTPKNELSGLVIICHGLGDTAEGFADVAEDLASKFPHIKFILPTAPTQPVTMNMGMSMPSWYDIVGLDERSNEKCQGIHDSRSKLASILQTEHESTGLPYHRMVLAGFSQGGALSLFTGMQLTSPQQQLGGILVMSGYLPCAAQFTIQRGLETTPILHLHGKMDPLVKHSMAEKSREYVTAKGASNYILKSYETLTHTVSMEELKDVANFLASVLPNDSSFQIKVKEAKDMSIKELKEVIKKAGISHKAAGFMEKSDFIKLVEDYRNGKL